jgi:arabinose-5-phosphate isomerase
MKISELGYTTVMSMLKLLEKQRDLLDYFYQNLDVSSLQCLIKEISTCSGVLFFTGVGKSGFIAQKIAATMQSTGTKAFFLSPIDALHGDLGMLSKEDHVVILSKSGETQELLELIPPLRNKGSLLIALCSNGKSRLVQSVDRTLVLPCKGELCPFDLAPTVSTEIQLLGGDLLAISLMEKKQFSIEKYAENHPSGQIGKRALYKVSDLMLREQDAPLCTPESTLKEILPTYSEKQCGCMIVIDQDKRLRGILTDGDLRRALQKEGTDVLQEKIEKLMTQAPRTISMDEPAWNAIKAMEGNQKNPITVMPVVDKKNERVVGLIKMHDLIQAGL